MTADGEKLDDRTRRSRRLRIAAFIVVLLVLAGGGWWQFIRPHTTHITFGGKPVDDTNTVLTTAQAQMAGLVRLNHGAIAPSSRCYFQRPSHRALGADKSDVAASVQCGPVLFYDGSRSRPYLSYELFAANQSGGAVHLTVAKQPNGDVPAAVAAGTTLVRPGGTSHPRSDAGMAVPIPPAARQDVLQAVTTFGAVDLAAPKVSAVMGSNAATVTVSASSWVTHFGSGASERSAPPGQKLIGFELAIGPGENLPVSFSTLRLGISVDGSPPRQLPLADAGAQNFVAAVNDAASSVDLVLTDAGITQQLALPGGFPAASNIAVLNGQQPYEDPAQSGTAVGAVDAYGQSFTAHLNITFRTAALSFFIAPDYVHPDSPTDAFLWVDLCYQSNDFTDATSCHTFRNTDLSVTPTGGQPIPGRWAGAVDNSDVVFEVPATFRTGSITVSGSESSDDGWAMQLTQPFTAPISLSN